MNISNETAIRLLLQLFNENKLSFRDMKVLKDNFDKTIEDCDEERTESVANWQVGRGSKPALASKDIEDDRFLVKEKEVQSFLAKRGVKGSKKATEVVVELLMQDEDQSDYFY